MAAASAGPVAEGGVGGGTGMVCHEFKGGIGTASRVVPDEAGGWTVGVLVQANYGRRELAADRRRPGRRGDPDDRGPVALRRIRCGRRRTCGARHPRPAPFRGSIIILVATDAPLLPHQCDRLAQRAGLGLARMGSTGGHYSGDLFLAFATGNRHLPTPSGEGDARSTVDVRMVADRVMDPLFDADDRGDRGGDRERPGAAQTMVGRDGVTAHALPHDRLLETMARYGRPARPAG